MNLDRIKKSESIIESIGGIAFLIWLIVIKDPFWEPLTFYIWTVGLVISVALSGILYYQKRKGNVPKGDYRPGILFIVSSLLLGIVIAAMSIWVAPDVLLLKILMWVAAAAYIGFSIWAFSNRKNLREKGRMK